MPHFIYQPVYGQVGGMVQYGAGLNATITDVNGNPLTVTLTNGGTSTTVVPDATGRIEFDTGASGPGVVQVTIGTFTQQVTSGSWAAGLPAQLTSIVSGSPSDTAVNALVSTSGTATRTTLDGLYTPKSFLGMTFPSVTGDITALQAAADSCATSGNRLVSAGTMSTSTQLTLRCDADISAINWTFTGTTGTAVQCGDPTQANFRKTVKLPRSLIASAKTVTGWAQVAGTVGVDVVNCYSWSITVPYVNNFETGLQLRGSTSNGTQQTSIHLGHLDNNKRNINFTGDATGWANQDYFFGGRCSHNSSEGSQVAGTRHVLFNNLTNPVNGHNFFGTSLESPDVVEYHIEAANTQWNSFWGARFENTGGDTHRRILSSGASKNNKLAGGAYAENVTQVVTSPALPFDIDAPAMTTKHGGTSTVPTLLVENVFSSTASALTIMAAGAGAAGDSPATAYAALITANKWQGKRSTDSFNRLEIDAQNGRLYVGDATAAPVAYLGGSPSAMFVGGSVPFLPLTTATQDLGSASLKWRNGIFSNYVKVGSYATASRPSAATSGAGASVYDTTLSKPVWSDGTNWNDAGGSATTAIPRPVSAAVYASTFPSVMRPAATDTAQQIWLCTGTNDDVAINAAITAVRATTSTGRVQLIGDQFVIGATIAMKTGIDLSGEGVGTEIKAASGFSTGMITLADNTAHATKVHDLWLNGNSQAVHGIYYSESGGQLFTARPATNPDPAHWIRDMLITSIGTSTFAGYGLLIEGGNMRAGHYADMRINGCTGVGVWCNGAVDSNYTGIEVGSSGSGGPTPTRVTTAPVGQGFYIWGNNNMITACKSWYNRDAGFLNRNPRNQYANCQAQDNYGAGFYMYQGKATLTGCHADSNGQAWATGVATSFQTVDATAQLRSGFYLPDAWLSLSACQSYDRGGQTWVQQYGFQFTSSFQYSRISACNTYSNAVASQTGTIGTGSTVDIAADSGGF